MDIEETQPSAARDLTIGVGLTSPIPSTASGREGETAPAVILEDIPSGTDLASLTSLTSVTSNVKEGNLMQDTNTTVTTPSTSTTVSKSDRNTASLAAVGSKTGVKNKKNENGHQTTFTVTVVIACSKGSDEQSKLLEELTKRNKRTLEAPKPQQFFHCEYEIAPKQERTVVDIVSYGIAAKVFTDNDSRVIKTWDDGEKIWIAWVNSHELSITEENILDIYNHTFAFKLWDSKERVSAKARFDRPKAFRIPSTKGANPGKGVASIVAKQSRSYTSLQPKDSAPAILISTSDGKSLWEDPVTTQPELRPPSVRVRESVGRLAGLDVDDQGNMRTNESNIKPKSTKNISKKQMEPINDDKHPDLIPGKETRRDSAESTQTKSVTIPLKLELLFSGLREITARLDCRRPNVKDMLVSVSVGGRLMPEDLERKLNPLVITIKSLKDLPDTPIPRNRLSELCQPVYCSYKFLDQRVHKTLQRPHSKNVHFQDVHVILVGKIDSGKLFEFLHSDGLSVEVHDRDRKLPDAAKPPTIFGDDTDDKKIANVGLVSSKNTTHNAFYDRHLIYDPFGVTKIRLNELLHGNATLTFTAVVNPCPVPDLLTNPINAESGSRLVGVEGSIDRPENPPLPTGDYLSSGTTVKVKASLKYPLTWSVPLESDVNEESCSFGRIIYHVSYGNKSFMQLLESFVTESNTTALGFDHFDKNVSEAALSTYKLSEFQRNSTTLDVITGFHVIDGEFHLLVLEGLKNGTMKRLQHEIGHGPSNNREFVHMLCDTSVSFKSRLYAELDINLCKVRLHQPLANILEQPLLYVRDLVPRPCFQCLMMLKDILKSNCLKDVCRNALFPSHSMVISMSREFGIPIAHDDFEEHHKRKLQEDEKSTSTLARERSPKWTPINNTNKEFDTYMSERNKFQGPKLDYVLSNIVSVQEAGCHQRPVSRARIYADVPAPCFNYSTQALNSTELSKTALRKMLYDNDKDGRYALNEIYNSAMIPPVDEELFYREEEDSIKRGWKTEAGFIFPGVKTSLMSNVHPHYPDKARVDELHLKWRENTLHDHMLKPTLRRDVWSWDLRKQDMNLCRKPPAEFGKSPFSIHLPSYKAAQEVEESKRQALNEWKSKIIVDNERMKFHAVGSKTEPPLSISKQVDKLDKLLKDEPNKLSLKFNAPKLPPLAVISYPEAKKKEVGSCNRMPPQLRRSRKSLVIGLQPGPFENASLKMDKNTIPLRDPEHQRFTLLKGNDFTTFLKVKEYLWKKSIPPLSIREKQDDLFHEVLRPTAPRMKVVGKPPLQPLEEDKRSEYRARYMPAPDVRPRLSIFPRNQLGGLGHLLQKDASVDVTATLEEATKFLKTQEENKTSVASSGTMLSNDVQIVKSTSEISALQTAK